MIVKIGDIFSSKAQTIVNTVNCVGVMGKGIAFEFKKRYPKMYEEYKELCKHNKVKPGIPYHYTDLIGTSIINFPTKNHWRSPAKLSYVINGLDWFCENYKKLGIVSVAFPPLGCGNGGLTWDVVGPIMYEKLKDLSIDVEIYAPYGTPTEQLKSEYLKNNYKHDGNDILGAKGIKFNNYWLMIPYIIQLLNNDKYSLNVGRVIFQKICYILTRMGIPTGFNFIKGTYGPYAPEVNEARLLLSNANLITESQLGNMVVTQVTYNFNFNFNNYSKEEILAIKKTYDLLSRIKNTEQAEIISTIIFSYDVLVNNKQPTEKEIIKYIMDWKPRWEEQEWNIINNIKDLAGLGWISPSLSYEQEELY